MGNQFEKSFTPFKIGKVTIKNRYCMGPMGMSIGFSSPCQWNEGGIDYLVERAKGGFGLIYTGALTTDIAVDPFSPVESLSPLYSPMNFMRSSLQLTERIHNYGAKIFAQITMGLGRNYPGLPAPSEVPIFGNPDVKARALTHDEIKKKIEQMIQAAVLMKNSGFDGVEVHAMHWGYLLDQFAMSITNHRTDEYGGSLENRMRCAKEIVEGIKQACGADFPVSMRLGLKSYIKGLNQASFTGEDEAGRTLEEGIEICRMLESYGYDVLSVDAGIYDSFYYAEAPIYMPKGYLIDLAAEAKKAVKIPVLLGSRMDDPEMCEKAVAEGRIDGMVLARASLADPHYAKKVEMGKPEKIRPCIACQTACINRAFSGGDASCAVNPQALRESWYGIGKALAPKSVAVVGGGIAGMEFARTATLRGHKVELYEKSGELGGNIIPGGKHSFKKEMNQLNEWYRNELKDLNIPVHLNTELDADQVKKLGADVVVLAVGSVPITPKLPGIDHPKAVPCIDALLGKKAVGQKVVVVGGGQVGCEMALEYAQEGKQVTVVEALDSILSAGAPVPLMGKMMLSDALVHYKADIKTGCRLESINDKGAVISSVKDGKSCEIEADTVIIAIGFKSLPSMAKELFGTGTEVYEIGDGKEVGNINTTIWDAYEVARSI